VTEEKIREHDEGSDEETNATEERGRRWANEILGRGTRTRVVLEYSPPGEYLKNYN